MRQCRRWAMPWRSCTAFTSCPRTLTGLVLVDMHAAHERITYERMKPPMRTKIVRTQPLLVPQTVAVSQREADCAETYAALFAELGLGLQRAGEEALVTMREVPVSLRDADVEQLLRDVLSDLLNMAPQIASQSPISTSCCRPWPVTARCAPTGA